MGDEREAPAITPVLARFGRSFPIKTVTSPDQPAQRSQSSLLWRPNSFLHLFKRLEQR